MKRGCAKGYGAGMGDERWVWVDIDLVRLIKNAESEGVVLTEPAAHKVLKTFGFESRGGGWIAKESALQYLKEGELRRCTTWDGPRPGPAWSPDR
jgi:hypothetical protein